MKNWDDLRIFLAAARAVSAREAARTLGVNQSTVARRLKHLEDSVGAQLLERRARGLDLTDLGREIMGKAEEIEAGFTELDRLFLSLDRRPSGRVRLSVADGLIALVAPVIAEVVKTHPNIQIDVEVNNGLANVSRLEADVVLRVASSPPEHLVGRRIASMIGAPYASVNYLPAVPTVERLAQHQWIRWAAPWQGLSVERWISANVSPSHVLATVDSVRTLTELVAQGLGVGFLPCFSADIDPRVVRVGDRVDLGASIWLLTHDELRKTGRIAAFMRCAGEALLQSRPEIEGPFPDDKTAKAPI